MGRHVIAVAPHDLTMVRKGDYVFSHFYDIALVMVKLGILAFYHRVFAVPFFRKVVLATATFIVAWGIGITVTLALVCRPIEAFWDADVKGTCLHLVEFTYFTNISNLITDIWIFLLPVPVIWHLQLQTKRKLLLCFIFSIGLAYVQSPMRADAALTHLYRTCIVSAIRLTVVLGHGDPDFTWSYVPLGAYSAFEPLGGILCTNLPIIWHMWRKQHPLLPGSSAFKSPHASSGTPSSAGSRRSRLARSLGFSAHDPTYNDSQSRTIMANDEESGANWMSIPGASDPALKKDVVIAKPLPDAYFNKVEKVSTTTTQETTEVGSSQGGREREHSASESAHEPPKRQSWASKSSNKNPNGIKKNVWEVRRK
jgi:hypothetical protein